MAKDADVILLSQGWEDHSHRPTLRALPKDIPVVASPAAAEVAASLGFKDVTSLRDGARTAVMPRGRGRGGQDWGRGREEGREGGGGAGVTVRATAGALVGPPWSEREAGFIISEREDEERGATVGGGSGVGGGGMRVYYEPHCSYDASSLAAAARLVGGRVDVAITPVRSVDVMGFPLVNGGEAAADLLGGGATHALSSFDPPRA